MINFRFGVSERSFSAVMSLPAELILANRNLLFQFTPRKKLPFLAALQRRFPGSFSLILNFFIKNHQFFSHFAFKTPNIVLDMKFGMCYYSEAFEKASYIAG